MSRIFFLAGMIAFAMLGCVKLNRAPVNIMAYALEAARPADPPARPRAQGIVLKLRPFRTADMFDQKKFSYKLPDATWKADFYNEFYAAPAQMAMAATEKWLGDSGAAGQVVPGASRAAATHYLEGTVREVFGDYQTPGGPKGVVAIEFLLFDERHAPARIALHKTYRVATAIAAPDAAALSAGLNGSLAAILGELESDLAALDWQFPPAAQ